MKTISKKKARKLAVAANRASKAAQRHEELAREFWALFEELTGSSCDNSNMGVGADDPLVDIVDYGRSLTDPEEIQKLVSDILEDDNSLEE